MNIKLGEDQENAFNDVKDFIHYSSDISYSIIGYAGTGKTLLIKYIIEYLEKIHKSYVLCAPTHKAKVVLERFTSREGMTLHKLLSLSPMIEIMNLDLKDLKFFIGKEIPLFPRNGIIICDESSMINDELFDLLENKAKSFGCKLIFVGKNIAHVKPI